MSHLRSFSKFGLNKLSKNMVSILYVALRPCTINLFGVLLVSSLYVSCIQYISRLCSSCLSQLHIDIPLSYDTVQTPRMELSNQCQYIPGVCEPVRHVVGCALDTLHHEYTHGYNPPSSPLYLSNLSVLLEDGAKGLVGRLPRQATDKNLLVDLETYGMAWQPMLTL